MNAITAEQKQATCRQRIGAHYRSRMADIRKLWGLYCEGNEDGDPDLGSWHEYGLSFDYVEANTFKGQRAGYFRYQLSWGGPSDEFRFYTDAGLNVERIEYRFMDWFDGAGRTVKGDNEALLLEIWDDWKECEVPQAAFRKTTEG